MCYYKTSVLVHPVSSDYELEDMWIKVAEEHNCDTFYFSFVHGASIALDFVKNILRI